MATVVLLAEIGNEKTKRLEHDIVRRLILFQERTLHGRDESLGSDDGNAAVICEDAWGHVFEFESEPGASCSEYSLSRWSYTTDAGEAAQRVSERVGFYSQTWATGGTVILERQGKRKAKEYYKGNLGKWGKAGPGRISKGSKGLYWIKMDVEYYTSHRIGGGLADSVPLRRKRVRFNLRDGEEQSATS